jgi:hypothetical protein
MPNRVSELRNNARHCRELSFNSPPDGMMCRELAKMAAEFDEQADILEQNDSLPPEQKELSASSPKQI